MANSRFHFISNFYYCFFQEKVTQRKASIGLGMGLGSQNGCEVNIKNMSKYVDSFQVCGNYLMKSMVFYYLKVQMVIFLKVM